MTKRRALGVLVVSAVSSAGCAFQGGGPSQGQQPGDCYNIDVCAALPLEQVNAALGGPFSYPISVTVADGSAGGYADECTYSKPGTVGVHVVRSCSTAEGVMTEFDQHYTAKVFPPSTHTDLIGVGDRAFVIDSPNVSGDGNYATLFAVQGKVSVMIDDSEVRAGDNVHEGLATLANVLFAQ